jgi:hypothetical protein
MKDSHRPASFRPMMVTIGISFGICLYQSYCGLVARQIDAHMVWMYRAFIITFTTPMIRFYPLLLRRIFGTECTMQNVDRLVMASTAVSACSMFVLLVLVQVKTQPKLWDGFLKLQLSVLFCWSWYVSGRFRGRGLSSSGWFNVHCRRQQRSPKENEQKEGVTQVNMQLLIIVCC